MKILGIGVDIVKNKRIDNLIKNKMFILRTFGTSEIEFSKKITNKVNYFAKRFAAKEALVKSFGTGFRDNLNFKDIQILNDEIGKPYYRKSKKLVKLLTENLKLKIITCFYQFLMKKIIQLHLRYYKKNNVR